MKRNALFVFTIIILMLTGSLVYAEDPSVYALEWLPKYAHKKALLNVEKATSLVVMTCMGDDAELKKNIEKIKETPPALVITFSDAISKSVASECPNVPLLAVLIDDASCVERAKGAAPACAIVSRPDVSMVWRAMSESRQNLKIAGMLYTKGQQANEKLFEKLSEEAKHNGATLISVLVDAGYCRTDADFVAAVDNAIEKENCELLFVPEDPNGSRFGATIFRAASAHGAPCVGTDATDGKGCVAALCVDYDKLAEQVSAIALGLINKSMNPPQNAEVPFKTTCH